MNKAIRYVLIMIISFSLIAVSKFLNSNYINDSLADNLFLIYIGIFTIHASTSAILISQLNILNQHKKINFFLTRDSIKDSFIEEGFILFSVIFTSIVKHSKIEFLNISEWKMIISCIQIFLLLTQLWIIYDVIIAILDSFKFTTSNE
jgi:hypothetical protein